MSLFVMLKYPTREEGPDPGVPGDAVVWGPVWSGDAGGGGNCAGRFNEHSFVHCCGAATEATRYQSQPHAFGRCSDREVLQPTMEPGKTLALPGGN